MKIAVCDDENKIVEEITSYIKKDFSACEVKAYSDGEAFLAAS
jgi:phosphoribosylpyrophosphate synthetase